jgi:hypothetical protein
MDNQLRTFLRAADAAACTWFNQFGGALEAIGMSVVVSDLPLSTQIGTGLLLANAAAQKNCTYDQGESPEETKIDGCKKVANGWGTPQYKDSSGNWQATTQPGIYKVTQMTDVDPQASFASFTWGYYATLTHTSNQGAGPLGDLTSREFLRVGFNEADVNASVLRLEPVQGTCEETSTPTPIPPSPPDVTYTDPDNNCNIVVKFLGYAEGPSGLTYQITDQRPALLRSSGGVISGCNFNPSIVINPIGGGSGNNDPPIVIPNPDNPPPSPVPGQEWWVPYVAGALGGIVAAATEQVIEALFARSYPGLIYRMVSVCEKNAAGEPISESVEVPIPALTAPDAQLARLDAIVELLQAAKNFKQPVCPPDRPELLGDWVTVRFESIENSPQGTRPLRKLFRYRSQSALDLGQIAAYWENFTWNAGPVCVQHKNAWWGTPQCWAANADEGKRVIRYAGLEAGIDPDAVGEWVLSGSSDPRFGMSGSMRVAKVEGLDWITSRQGPSGLPLLTVDP